MSKDSSKTHFEIRRLSAVHAVSNRDLRLDGLRAHKAAFGASWEEEAARPLDWFAERLERNFILGETSSIHRTPAGDRRIRVRDFSGMAWNGAR
jgi:hypothetical protein